MRMNEVILEKRKALNMTQEQMADCLGVTAPAVHKWEKGISFPDVTILPALARLLKIDLHTLYGGVVPELAARAHILAIDDVVRQTLHKANKTIDDIDVVAATAGPGLIGGVLVGWMAATGIAQCGDDLVTILDFEKIVAEISPDASIQVEEIEQMGSRHSSQKTILIAEDSMLLSKLIIECLHKAGYNNTIKTDTGQEAWDYLCEVKDSGDHLLEHVSCIVSDIEMPMMDGHRLTKLVKEDPELKKIPLILFSSLISEEMRIKGEQLGADAQISKPEIGKLVSLIDELTAHQ